MVCIGLDIIFPRFRPEGVNIKKVRMGRISKCLQKALIGIAAEILVMFKDQIVLKQDPIDRIPAKIAEKAFKTFHEIGRASCRERV